MNITSCPSEIIFKIFQEAGCPVELASVCKIFFNHFPQAFLHVCENIPSLKERVTYIRSCFPSLPAQEVKKELYFQLLQDVKEMQNSPMVTEQDALNFRYISIKNVHQLESWLEEDSLIQLAKKIQDHAPGMETFLEDIKEKNMSEKASDIRNWFFSYEEDLQQITTLDLEQCCTRYHDHELWGSGQLSKAIGLFTHLQELNLRQNALRSLPIEIGRLTQLKVLCAMENNIRSLPTEIGNLSQLVEFYLHSNQLVTLPVTIGCLTQLTKLELTLNKITHLPEQIGNLFQLQELHLFYNKLKNLPMQISQLTQLKLLNISCNKFKNLPIQISHLIQLDQMEVQGNKLTNLPEYVGHLTRLTHLDLEHNKLTSVPENLSKLTQLKHLNVRHNKLTELPATLYDLPLLDRCDLIEMMSQGDFQNSPYQDLQSTSGNSSESDTSEDREI